jgi:hypothetical protein
MFDTNIWYLGRKVYQFSEVWPVYQRLGGRFLVHKKYISTWLELNVTHRPFSCIMAGSFLSLPRQVHGAVLCQSAFDMGIEKDRRLCRIFTYHGTTDKPLGTEDGSLSVDSYDYYMVDGEKFLWQLRKATGNNPDLDKRVVRIGKLHADRIVNQTVSREELLRRLHIPDDGRKIILYAPTWKWGGGTFRRCFRLFCEQIPEEYLVVMRPHYNDRRITRDFKKWFRQNPKEHILFRDSHGIDITDLILASDCLIGDNSAVNYDFLFTGHPMIFVQHEGVACIESPPEFDIRKCGPLFNPDRDSIAETIASVIHDNPYRQAMDSVLKASFYFNDGHAVDRTCSFIESLIHNFNTWPEGPVTPDSAGV